MIINDINIAAALIVCGFKFHRAIPNEGNKMEFEFKIHDESIDDIAVDPHMSASAIKDFIQAYYNNDVTVDALTFIGKRNFLKNVIANVRSKGNK